MAGRYVFKLKVTDAQGLSSEDAVSVIIHPDPLSLHLVQLTLNADAGMLTESQVTNMGLLRVHIFQLSNVI